MYVYHSQAESNWSHTVKPSDAFIFLPSKSIAMIKGISGSRKNGKIKKNWKLLDYRQWLVSIFDNKY
jgi:ribosomal silencing factor RsfS